MRHVLAFPSGDVEFELPDGATFTGLCATCLYCDGPLPIIRFGAPGRLGQFWATCPKHECSRQFWITGVEGPDDAPTFRMIPYHHSNTETSDKWMGLERKP